MSEVINKKCVKIDFYTKDNFPERLKKIALKQGFDVDKQEGVICVKTFV